MKPKRTDPFAMLALLREAAGLTLHDVARQAGVSHSTVWRLEQGYAISVKNVAKKARVERVMQQMRRQLDRLPVLDTGGA